MASQSFRNFYEHLPPPAECLAILVGCVELTVFGLGGIANPLEFSKGYGLPIVPSTSNTDTSIRSSTQKADQAEKESRNQRALIAAIAARNAQNGILLLTFALYTRDRKSLGIAVVAGLVATVADTLIVRAYGVQEAVFGHVFGIFNCCAIGGSLLYWNRSDVWFN